MLQQNLLASILPVAVADGTGFETLHSFGGEDGRWPTGALAVAADGTIYGTTEFGGYQDQGTAFNPLQAEPVNLDEHIAQRRRGGLGMHLMQTLMDAVDYRREGDFNVLTLTKKAGPA